MVETGSGKITTPYTKEQEEKVAALLMEKRELIKQTKMLTLMEEQKAKQKQMEEELQKWEKEHEKKLAAIESETEEEEEEIPLREQFARELKGEENPMKRHVMEEEKKLEWKLRLARERKRRLEAAKKMERDLRAVEVEHGRLVAQVDLQKKVEILSQSVEVMLKAQQEQLRYLKGHDITLQSMRTGFKDFAKDMMMHVGTELRTIMEGTHKFCVDAIEDAKIVGPREEEARPRRESVKVKFPDSYSGKKEENFDNWEVNVNSYVHLQKIAHEEHVLIGFHALKDEAVSVARSLCRTAKCENDMVAYSLITPLSDCFKLQRERFADVMRSVRASYKLQTIHSRQWRSVRALKGVLDEFVAVPDHGVTEAQLVQLFYRAMPESLRGCLKSRESAMTYDTLSGEVEAFEARSMPVSTFWHKDLDRARSGKAAPSRCWATADRSTTRNTEDWASG
ncbi:hypothetical protein CBR_g54817 [Chara braunii]|uniref:Uncharacterized protein n=1 Tax=Chara braunii TaxID=69332 RepID=A0A388JPS3_CHABU|nr:hypothetical protein CBR_g54817 [Chara braunii]|eukprot:GBG59712.1 hypothetical protein CBR_g54817 [Chara braunii]